MIGCQRGGQGWPLEPTTGGGSVPDIVEPIVLVEIDDVVLNVPIVDGTVENGDDPVEPSDDDPNDEPGIVPLFANGWLIELVPIAPMAVEALPVLMPGLPRPKVGEVEGIERPLENIPDVEPDPPNGSVFVNVDGGSGEIDTFG